MNYFFNNFRYTPYFVEAAVAGLDEDGKPYVASSDTIGCMTIPSDFVAIGTAVEPLVGVCEAFWDKDMV